MAEALHTPAQEKPFHWNKAKVQAAGLVARDEQTEEQIATAIGASRRSLCTWKKHPAFIARVDQHVAEFRAQVRKQGIAIIENRVRQQQLRYELLLKIMQDTGGKRKDGSVDTGLIRELRELEKHTATELGQWTEKHETVNKVPVRIQFDVTDDQPAAEASSPTASSSSSGG